MSAGAGVGSSGDGSAVIGTAFVRELEEVYAIIPASLLPKILPVPELLAKSLAYLNTKDALTAGVRFVMTKADLKRVLATNCAAGIESIALSLFHPPIALLISVDKSPERVYNFKRKKPRIHQFAPEDVLVVNVVGPASTTPLYVNPERPKAEAMSFSLSGSTSTTETVLTATAFKDLAVLKGSGVLWGHASDSESDTEYSSDFESDSSCGAAR